MCLLLRSSSIGQHFDTGGGRNLVEMSTKLRPPQCRNFDRTSTELRPNFDQTSTKLRPHFDQTSTPPVSKFGRRLLGISMQCIVHLINKKNVYQTATPNFDQTSTKLRPNVAQTSTKLRPNFDTGGSKFGRNLDQTSTPNRSN